MHNGSDMMMKMYFHTDFGDTILFKGWMVMKSAELAGAWFAIFILAALYEGLKVLREQLLVQQSKGRRLNTSIEASTTKLTISDTRLSQDKGIMRSMCDPMHLLQTLLHIVQVVISYFLMLIFMTYQVYLCLAVALGAGVGYFIFGWKRSTIVDLGEHCH
ncbi:high affinity copper uptake protein 1 [Lingula anatina]|uniref:Copper transport protein n=1 Tax=Lingula anatina TaxID=7574 RepID=A0A1S3H6S4_LINAN|nr:high affinity copper uptake protein 1 [Lingula anatina]|eukprot:XP_013381698.1 high affinity copper uptake protein 1 [Lingula anatina]